MAVELGLAMRAPFAFMNELGPTQALALVEAYAGRHPGFPVPRCLLDQARARGGRPFAIDFVLRRDVGDIAVLTIRRPKVLNALSEEVYDQLRVHFTVLRDDPAIAGVVLTGFGPKAFVSGADVHFLAGIETPEIGVTTSERSKEVGNLMEGLGKPIVCALNGFALGGGAELALCCTARIARPGLALAIGTPEVNLGIIPGAGATQRLPRLAGIETAAAMLRTGRGLSGPEAVRHGLIREEVEGNLLEAAVALAGAAARGEIRLAPIDPAPLKTPDQLPSDGAGPSERGDRCPALPGDPGGVPAASARGAAHRVGAVRRVLPDRGHADRGSELPGQRTARKGCLPAPVTLPPGDSRDRNPGSNGC